VLTDAEMTALWLSVKVASAAVLGTSPFALGCAALLAFRQFWGRSLLSAILHIPLVLPPVVMGYLLLVTFGARGALGQGLEAAFGVRFAFSWTGAALAAGVMTFPFQLRAMRQAFEAMDRRYLDVAATLGAGPVDRFFTVILPLTAPGIIAGLVTAFSAALGEFGAIITFVANIPGETQTLPLAIYSALQSPGGETVAARLSLLSITLAFSGLILSEGLLARVHRTHRP